jgi:hypothetical protein
MKLSELLGKFRPGLKAKLLVEIKLNNGSVMPKGVISDLLIDKGNGTYHFEYDHDACEVKSEEIKIL